MAVDINRDTIKVWLGTWVESHEGFYLVEASADCKYVQVVPWTKDKDPYNGGVHYEVIRRNEQWFAEFHVELYKSQGRDLLEEKLNKTLNETLSEKCSYFRSIFSDSHWGNRNWKSRRPILTQSDLIKDLDLLKGLVDDSGILKSKDGTGSGDGELSVAIKTVQLMEVLALDLQVPNYQRGYCWRMEDVRRMMIDIHAWQDKHNSGSYNIGTVVLKKESQKKESQTQKAEVYTIIDGQQRLTTFALYARLQQQGFKLGAFDLGENNKQEKSIGYLVRARDVLRSFIDKKRMADLNRLSINVVRLSAEASDDLAYLFFNHTNSLGRKLTDYELLKGHHLRFVDTGSQSVDCSVAAQKTGEIWNRLAQSLEVAPSGESSNKVVIKRGMEVVLHKTLYRLRKWEAGEKFSPWADDLPSHDVFHHFSTDDEPVEGVLSSARAVDYDSIVRDGPEFFYFAEKYRWKFSAYLQTAAVGALYANLRGHSNDVLFDIINALGFLFYDRFGEKYLPEALYSINYRVSEIRNKGRVMQRYLGDTSIRGISKWAMPSFLSSQINRSNHESILFPMLLDPARDYDVGSNPTATMQAYWTSVAKLIQTLESMMEISYVQNRAAGHRKKLDSNEKQEEAK